MSKNAEELLAKAPKDAIMIAAYQILRQDMARILDKRERITGDVGERVDELKHAMTELQLAASRHSKASKSG